MAQNTAYLNSHRAKEVLENQVIQIKRGRMNKFGFEPAWNAYYDFYLSDKYLESPILKLEDVAFHLFLRKNLNDHDPTWRMPSFRMMKRRLGVSQDRVEAMLDRLTQAHLLKKFSGRRKGKKKANVANTYVLSDPIQELEDFLAVAAAGAFPQPLRAEWKRPKEPPVPEIGTGGCTGNRYRAVPEIGTHKHTSYKQTSATEQTSTTAPKTRPDSHPSSSEPDPKDDVVVALTSHGLSKEVSQQFADRYRRDYIFEKINYLEYLQQHDPQKVTKPVGWLRRAIEKDYSAPDGYKSKAERAAEAAEQDRRRQQAAQAVASAEQEVEDLRRQEAEEQAQRLAQLQERYGTTQRELELWPQALRELQLQLPRATYQAWFPQTQLLSLTDGEALIAVPNGFARDWLEQRLAGKILATLTGLALPVERLRFEVLTD
jgi:hypothetical protein